MCEYIVVMDTWGLGISTIPLVLRGLLSPKIPNVQTLMNTFINLLCPKSLSIFLRFGPICTTVGCLLVRALVVNSNPF